MSGLPDDEAILARFREWLAAARAKEPLTQAGESDATGAGDVGLWRLVEEFTALRHEVKLTVKSSRNLGEQSDQAVSAMCAAIEAFQSILPREQEAARVAAKPAVEALADLDVALERGHKAIEQLLARAENAQRELDQRLQESFAGLSWWRRRSLGAYHQSVCQIAADALQTGGKRLLTALAEGHSLIHNRLRCAMAQQQLQRIACEGQMVDPQFMTVLEIAAVDDLPAGMVLEEIRPGYLWQGKVLRFAEVRAVGGKVAVQSTTTSQNGESAPAFSDDE